MKGTIQFVVCHSVLYVQLIIEINVLWVLITLQEC